jgi:hypothetical protein
VDSIEACRGYEGYPIVQDETAVGRRENAAQETCPLQHYFIRCFFVTVLQKADPGLAQFTGKAFDR